ncbi:hypothetical protein B0F90DRAFT_1705014 [Multifurca ochricompacta]|uniref:Uncharacterized protein n=1 Tax=Multifurca ochricompacta TaxID=376703 RepID=A0AAD4M6V8_9AGAM|nr:hypothetical protein B0F90DRAFT_1705014 [Multifurca ochricompacta]
MEPFFMPFREGMKAGESVPLGRDGLLIKCSQGCGHAGVVSCLHQNEQGTVVVFHCQNPHKCEVGTWKGRHEGGEQMLEKNEIRRKVLGLMRGEPMKERGGRHNINVGKEIPASKELANPSHNPEHLDISPHQPHTAASIHHPFLLMAHNSSGQSSHYFTVTATILGKG